MVSSGHYWKHGRRNKTLHIYQADRKNVVTAFQKAQWFSDGLTLPNVQMKKDLTIGEQKGNVCKLEKEDEEDKECEGKHIVIQYQKWIFPKIVLLKHRIYFQIFFYATGWLHAHSCQTQYLLPIPPKH